jgi:hypothetical protein
VQAQAAVGGHGFWNDEAWVLLPLAGAPAPPEVALRLLPLGFGLATPWLAWRLGARLAGHALGGLGALVLVAFDPNGIAWSQQLKHYTAEAALALWAFLAADAVVRRGRNADIAMLALVLTLGVTVSNAQLLLAPPLVAALLGEALMRPDRALLGRIALAGSAVALWDLAWFTLVIHPWGMRRARRAGDSPSAPGVSPDLRQASSLTMWVACIMRGPVFWRSP